MEKGAGEDTPPPFDNLFAGTGAQGDGILRAWEGPCGLTQENLIPNPSPSNGEGSRRGRTAAPSTPCSLEQALWVTGYFGKADSSLALGMAQGRVVCVQGRV